MINREATEFLYKGRRFVFDAMSNFGTWLEQIGGSTKFLTHIEVHISGVQLAPYIYRTLSEAKNLQYICMTFPKSIKGTLEKHVDEQWKHLRLFLLGRRATEAEALTRLNAVHFRIGKSQTSVIGVNGAVLKVITPALNSACIEHLRCHVRKHFAK